MKKAKHKATPPIKMGRPLEWTKDRIDEERRALEKWLANPDNYFLTGFLNERHLDPKHLERFCNYNEEFCQAYAHAKQVQEQRLVALAVSRKGDPGFIKFILQNKAGWKEKSEISGDSKNPLTLLMEHIARKPQDPLDINE